MELIPIGETKLKITLDEREMADYPLRRRDGNRAVLLRLFSEIKNRCGFDTSGSRVFVQMYPGRRGGCELYVTKLCARESPWSENSGGTGKGSLYLANALAEEYDDPAFPKPAIYHFDALSHLVSTCACLWKSGYSGASRAYREPAVRRFYLVLDHETYFAGEHLGTLCPQSIADYIAEHCDPFAENAVEKLGPLA